MKRKSVKILKEVISDLLYGGRGDAGRDELIAATSIFKVLEAEGHRVTDESIIETLSGENVYGYNYLTDSEND